MATQAQIRFEPLQIRTDGTSWLRWIETVAVHHAGPNGAQPLTIATLESASVFTPSDEDSNAYAQLFATAPVLYAALDAMVDTFSSEWASPMLKQRILSQAVLALAHARGEA